MICKLYPIRELYKQKDQGTGIVYTIVEYEFERQQRIKEVQDRQKETRK